MMLSTWNAALLGFCFFGSLGLFLAGLLRLPVSLRQVQLSSASLLLLALLLNWLAWTITVATRPEADTLPPWLTIVVLVGVGSATLLSLRNDRRQASLSPQHRLDTPPAGDASPEEPRRAA